jgi:hypothetical protein
MHVSRKEMETFATNGLTSSFLRLKRISRHLFNLGPNYIHVPMETVKKQCSKETENEKPQRVMDDKHTENAENHG